MSHRPTVYGTRHAVSAGHYLAASAGLLDPGSRRQCDRCRLRRRHRARRAAARPGERRRRRADHDPAGRTARSRASPASAGGRRRCRPICSCASTAARSPTACCAPWSPPRPMPGSPRCDATARCASPMSRRYAIRYAGEGFAVYPLLATSIAAHEHEYRRWQSNTAIFLPERPRAEVGREIRAVRPGAHAAVHGRPGPRRRPRPRWPGCARRTMRSIAATSRARSSASSSRRAAICRWTTSPSTARRIEPVVRRPWRGHEVITCGPWCQGPALLEALALLERVGIAGLAHNSADYLHRIAECVNLAMADREYHFGDPAFVDVPIDHLLDPATIARRAARGARRPGVRRDAGAARPHQPAAHAPARRELPKVEADTSYCCVVDRWGNAFSATPSDGSGNVPVVPGLGITPSGRGSQSRPDPRHPAGVAPGKRPRLTPNPAMVVTEDGGVMPFGTPGGDVQTQAMLQVLLNIFQYGMEVQDAIEAPRVASAIRSRRRSRRSSISPGGWRWRGGSIRRCATISPRAGTRCRTGRTGPGWRARSRRC